MVDGNFYDVYFVRIAVCGSEPMACYMAAKLGAIG